MSYDIKSTGFVLVIEVRKVGGSQKRWKGDLEETIGKDRAKIARDRKKWKEFEEACTLRGVPTV